MDIVVFELATTSKDDVLIINNDINVITQVAPYEWDTHTVFRGSSRADVEQLLEEVELMRSTIKTNKFEMEELPF